MSKAVYILLPVLAMAALSGCCKAERSCGIAVCCPKAPSSAEEICPVLIGAPLPKLVLNTPAAQPFDLNAAVAEKDTILIFYRGGWCPYCNTHLGQLQTVESQLVELGYQIIAISPDRPELLTPQAEEKGLKYSLLSDSKMKAALALGIAFKVDDATVIKYKTEYGIDMEGDSGQTHHLLPVPSVFIVGKDGTIKFSYVNPDYKVRLDPEVLLKAAEAVISD